MPYPEYKQEDIAFFISFISMFMILSFAIIIPPLIKRIVHEKESGIKVRFYNNFGITAYNVKHHIMIQVFIDIIFRRLSILLLLIFVGVT